MKLYGSLIGSTALTAATALLIGCGGSGGGYTPVKNGQQLNLTPSQKTASAQSLGTASVAQKQGRSGNAGSLTWSSGLQQAMSFDSNVAANSSGRQTFQISEEENCDVSGKMAVSGNGEASLEGNETTARISLKADETVSMNQCDDGDSMTNGQMKAALSVNASATKDKGSDDIKDFNVEAIFKFSGAIDGNGTNAQGARENHSIKFSDDFAFRIAFDKATADKLNVNINNDASDLSEAQLLELMSCSGSVTLDGTQYPCADFIKTNIDAFDEDPTI